MDNEIKYIYNNILDLDKNTSVVAILKLNNKYLLCERSTSFIMDKIFDYIYKLISLDYKFNFIFLFNYFSEKDVYYINYYIEKYKTLILNFDNDIQKFKNLPYFKFIKKIKRYFNVKDYKYIQIIVAYYVFKYKIKLKPNYKIHNYILPGGHCKQSENIIDGLYREIKEETNLNLYKLKHEIFDIYKIRVFDNIIRKEFLNIIFCINLDKTLDSNSINLKSNEVDKFSWNIFTSPVDIINFIFVNNTEILNRCNDIDVYTKTLKNKNKFKTEFILYQNNKILCSRNFNLSRSSYAEVEFFIINKALIFIEYFINKYVSSFINKFNTINTNININININSFIVILALEKKIDYIKNDNLNSIYTFLDSWSGNIRLNYMKCNKCVYNTRSRDFNHKTKIDKKNVINNNKIKQ